MIEEPYLVKYAKIVYTTTIIGNYAVFIQVIMILLQVVIASNLKERRARNEDNEAIQ